MVGFGVVRDVAKNVLRVRPEGRLKGVTRVEIEMTHGHIGRRGSRRTAGNALFDRHALAGRSQLLFDHGHVLGEIVGHVELAACRIGIEHAHLDHVFLRV